jgi:hypothetical protein
VAKAVLFGEGQFGHRLTCSGDNEERVVTEAVVATRDGSDLSFADPMPDSRLPHRTRQGDGAAEASYPWTWMCGEVLQQTGAAGGVAFGQASRTQAWSAAESIDFQPGIVGQRPQSGRLGVGQRLGDRIRGVVDALFGDGELDARSGQICQVNSGSAEQGAQFRQFARVRGGEKQEPLDAGRRLATRIVPDGEQWAQAPSNGRMLRPVVTQTRAYVTY